jgi:hypothetical protein
MFFKLLYKNLMNPSQVNKLTILLVALMSLPFIGRAQFKDFRKLHTVNFDPNKWSSGAAQYYENGYKKFEYRDLKNGKKKRIEYYDNGSLMSEMEVVFKSSRDTAVVIDTDTYQEIIQVIEINEVIPEGKYVEYHKDTQKGKNLIHLKGQFRNGKKTGQWKRTRPNGQSSEMVIQAGDTNVDHTDFASYTSIQEERKQLSKGANTTNAL